MIVCLLLSSSSPWEWLATSDWWAGPEAAGMTASGTLNRYLSPTSLPSWFPLRSEAPVPNR